MGFMAPLAVAGLALAAAGSAYNYSEKKKTQKAVKKINEQAQEKVDANTAQATERWQETLGELTPEAQEAVAADKAGQRLAEFERVTEDVPDATNVMNTTEGAPALVKTEAAKQLGDKLAEMRTMMQARSRLGGWDDRGLNTGTLLTRSRQDIGRLGNFSQGWSSAAALDAAKRAQYHKPIGDILIGAGALASMGAGAAGAAGAAGSAAAGTAGAAGAAGAGTAGTTAASATGGLGSTLLSGWDWLTTPMNKYQYGKPKPGLIPKPIGLQGTLPVGYYPGASDTGLY